MAGGIPTYLAQARPNPASNRAPWYMNTAQSYAGIFLWVVAFDVLAGNDAGDGALKMAGLGGCLFALVIAGGLASSLFYFVPGLLGMRTGLPLYIVGTSTFGTMGGYFIPGIFMGLLQIGWYSVATFIAADFLLRGIGLESYSVSLFGEGQQFGLLFVVTTVVLGYLFALVGALGIKHVARVATFFPIVSIIMLLVAARLAAPTVGDWEAPAALPVAGFLLIIQLVIGFFATAGAVGADFCSNNRDANDVKWGGIVGIWLPVVFAGGLAMIAVAGAHGIDPGLVSLRFRDALPVLNPTLGKIMLILFALGTVAPACFCSFIIGNSLSTMLGSERTRVPITLGGATLGIVLAALGLTGKLEPFFGLIAASFGPVIGAMIADYLLSGKKWAGPRAGISIPGYAAWVLGFLVGVQNHPLVDVLPGWEITGVYSLVVGFLVYLVLAKLGLEPRKVEVPGLCPAEAGAGEGAESAESAQEGAEGGQ
jgi:cytosine permease